MSINIMTLERYDVLLLRCYVQCSLIGIIGIIGDHLKLNYFLRYKYLITQENNLFLFFIFFMKKDDRIFIFYFFWVFMLNQSN